MLGAMNRGRQATLVVVDGGGALRGVTEPIAIDLPWWQEVWPLVDTMPGVTMLRLLDATPDVDQPMGGDVVYLVQCDDDWSDEDRSRPPLRAWPGPLGDEAAARVNEALAPDPQRHPWAEPGGPAADLRWVASITPITGPPRQIRSWNLSAIWSIPTELGPLWLKCVPPMFAHEAGVLELLAGSGTPTLVACDRHRLLLAEMPGEDGYDAEEAEQIEMVETLVSLQAGTAARVDELIERGVPDLRSERLVDELARLIERVAPDRPVLRRLIDELPGRLRDAAECGVPDALVHGDPHGGNCRRGVSPPMWFDWGDSFVGNPLLDVAALHRMAPPVVDHWVERWSQVVPGADAGRAWRRLEPVAALRMAWVYQRFVDNIEASEHIYHRADVADALVQTETICNRGL